MHQSRNHFCGVEDAARFFKVSADTVREWREAGAPFVLVGKKWQANYTEMWNWLKIYYAKKPVK